MLDTDRDDVEASAMEAWAEDHLGFDPAIEGGFLVEVKLTDEHLHQWRDSKSYHRFR